MTGATNDGREHGTRSIISSEAGLAHTGTIVHHEGLNVTVRHGECRERKRGRGKRKEIERRVVEEEWWMDCEQAM
jgi:hypothetical protein